MKITDKMRLDFLERSGWDGYGWSCADGDLVQTLMYRSATNYGRTPRKAIDAAIRASRRAKKEKP